MRNAAFSAAGITALLGCVMLGLSLGEANAATIVDTVLFNAASNSGGDDPTGLGTSFSSSTVLTGDTVEDAFGNNDGGVEATTLIFDSGTADNGNAVMGDGGETVDFIQWQTTSPVALAGFRFNGSGDGGGANRGTELVRFLVGGVEVDLFDFNAGSVATNRIFSGGLVTGSTFRVELTRTTTAGPRIREIDAIVQQGPTILIDGSSTDDSVGEGLPAGTLVGAFTVDNTNTTFSYSLVETNDYASFNLTGGSSSNLVTAAVFDYETKSSYTIRVEAAETGPGSLLLTNDFTIDVNYVDPFQDLFFDTFAGSGSASPSNSLATPATTASVDVSDYVANLGSISIVSNTVSSVGNPTPALNFFNGTNPDTMAFYMNLKTSEGATYRIQFECSLWGSDFGDKSYTLSAQAFDGADTTSGAALDSDMVSAVTGDAFSIKTVTLTFAAQSTDTTLYIDGTIGDTVNRNGWVDNLDIDVDPSTRKYQGTFITIK